MAWDTAFAHCLMSASGAHQVAIEPYAVGRLPAERLGRAALALYVEGEGVRHSHLEDL